MFNFEIELITSAVQCLVQKMNILVKLKPILYSNNPLQHLRKIKYRNSKRGEGGDPALIKNKVFWHAESQNILVFEPL